ncbi:SH2 domain-containing protein [Strongyloides ratti]|uniref:SH2 domain-containing protein n=1 Tax=Strongyloides ratti TaxID=34506 RepID=A0A090L776_STRRB|nr:SH2 domain-containing protein [Strongyloides ratti]CEF63354.1 SH2 domain-containing protein [Strongyloides ratti]
MTTTFASKMIDGSDNLSLMNENIINYSYESEMKLQLQNQIWYHGLIKRIEAELLLKNDGDFLVRDSISIDGKYVLTAQWLLKPLHFQINQEIINNMIYYKFEDEQFPSIVDLINFFRTHKRKVTLLSGCIISNPITCQLIKNKLSNKNHHISEIEANYARLFNSSTSPRLPKINRNLSQETILCNAKKYLNKSESNLKSLFDTKEKIDNNFKSTSNIKLNTLFSIQPQDTKLLSLSFIKEKEGEQDYCDIDYDTMENFPLPVHIKRLSINNDEKNMLSNLNKNYSNSVHDLQTNLGGNKNDHIHNDIGKTKSFSNLRLIVNPTNKRPVSLSSTSTSSSTNTTISNGSYNLNISNKHPKFITQPRSISRISMGKTAASIIADKKRELLPSLPQRPSEDTFNEEKVNNESISELIKLEKELKQSIMSLNNLVMINNDRDSACVLDTSNEGDYDCLPITNKCGSLSPDSVINNETDDSESESSLQTSLSPMNIFCDRLISMNVNTICRMITEEDIKLLNLHLEDKNEIINLLLPYGSIIRQECDEKSSILSEIVINTLYNSSNTKVVLEIWTRVASSLLHDYGNLFSFASIMISLKQFYDEHHYTIDSDDSSLKLIKSLLTPLFEDLKNRGEINYKNNTGTTMIPYIQPFIKIYNNDSFKNYESSLIVSNENITPIDKQLDYMWTWLSIGRKWCQNANLFVNKAKLFYKPENEIKHNIFEISQLRMLLNNIKQDKKNERCYTDKMYIDNNN